MQWLREYVLDIGNPYQPPFVAKNKVFRSYLNSEFNGVLPYQVYEMFTGNYTGDNELPSSGSGVLLPEYRPKTGVDVEAVGREIYAWGNSSQAGRRITELNIAFNILKTASMSKDKYSITIYNASKETLDLLGNSINQKLYIRLQAGYRYGAPDDANGNTNTATSTMVEICRGVIERFETYRNGADILTKIKVDASPDLSWGMSVVEFSAGARLKDVVRALLQDLGSSSQSYSVIPDDVKLNYPLYLSGKSADILRRLGNTYGYTFTASDLSVNLVSSSGSPAAVRSYAPIITEDNGLLDKIEFVNNSSGTQGSSASSQAGVGTGQGGIKFTTILNGSIAVGQPVELRMSPGSIYARFNGTYDVTKLLHKGDYTGSDWTTHVQCTKRAEIPQHGATGSYEVVGGGATGSF